MLKLLQVVIFLVFFLSTGNRQFFFLAEQQYPATLILTADHDDRVSPLHSLKYVAALHHEIKKSTVQQNPLLLRVYSKAGHGVGKPTAKKIEETTDILTFMYRALKIESIKG